MTTNFSKLRDLYPWLLPFAFLVAVLAVYLPSLRNEFIYDDQVVILNQHKIQRIRDLVKIFSERHFPVLPYYRPVVRSSLLLEKTLHGDDARYFHLVNALLLAIAGLMAYLLLTVDAFGVRRCPAFLGAMLFMLHPIASSCVYPIASGRETLLPAILIMASVYAFLQSGNSWYVLAILGFAVSLLSKEQAIIVPLLFFLCDILKLTANPPSGRRWVTRYIPVLCITAVYFLIRFRLFAGSEYSGILENPQLPFFSILYCVQNFFIPFKGLVYEPTLDVWLSAFRAALSLLLLLAILFGIVRRRHELGKFSLFWGGWFFLALLPTANILVQETQFSERYIFLSILALVAFLAKFASVFWDKTATRWSVIAAGIITILIFGGITRHRGSYFRNDRAFFQQWLQTNPGKDIALYNMGMIFLREGNLDQAKRRFQRCIKASTRFAAGAHNNLGQIYAYEGEKGLARKHYEEALRIWPPHIPARLNLARLLASQGRTLEAARNYFQLIKRNVRIPEAYYYIGFVLMKKGKLDRAMGYCREALRLRPEYPEAHYTLGMVYEAQGKLGESVREYDEAVRLKSPWPEVENNLAWILATSRDASIRNGKKAVRLAKSAATEFAAPKRPGALDTLAAAYAEAGRFGDAVQTASRAYKGALRQGNRTLAEKIHGRIALYRAGRPFHQG